MTFTSIGAQCSGKEEVFQSKAKVFWIIRSHGQVGISTPMGMLILAHKWLISIAFMFFATNIYWGIVLH